MYTYVMNRYPDRSSDDPNRRQWPLTPSLWERLQQNAVPSMLLLGVLCGVAYLAISLVLA